MDFTIEEGARRDVQASSPTSYVYYIKASFHELKLEELAELRQMLIEFMQKRK